MLEYSTLSLTGFPASEPSVKPVLRVQTTTLLTQHSCIASLSCLKCVNSPNSAEEGLTFSCHIPTTHWAWALPTVGTTQDSVSVSC